MKLIMRSWMTSVMCEVYRVVLGYSPNDPKSGDEVLSWRKKQPMADRHCFVCVRKSTVLISSEANMSRLCKSFTSLFQF